jgi:hypothetical protein
MISQLLGIAVSIIIFLTLEIAIVSDSSNICCTIACVNAA